MWQLIIFKVKITHWYQNLYAENRRIYFICDVPHLMKTTRNNFENSHGNKNTRDLLYNGQHISWQHLVSLYEWDLGMHRFAPGLRKLHKLTEEHIHLSPRSRMRVYLAVQWLENVFLKFLNEWKNETTDMALPKNYKNRLCLSFQTLEGLRITVHSFVNLTRELLQLPGVDYFLSDKLNQDVVEEHFGRQRMRGGACDNPTLMEYGQNELKLIVAKTDLIQQMQGNTKGRIRERSLVSINSEEELPKRKKTE